MPATGRDIAFVEQAYWILLGRAPASIELADERQGQLNSDQTTLLRGLLSSAEFGRIVRAWKDGRDAYPDPAAVEAALVKLGPPELFVRRAYESILGRAPDRPPHQRRAG